MREMTKIKTRNNKITQQKTSRPETGWVGREQITNFSFYIYDLANTHGMIASSVTSLDIKATANH